MLALLSSLSNAMVERASYRNFLPHVSLHSVESSCISRKMLRRLEKKLSIEKHFSETLSSIQARYKDVNSAVQLLLEMQQKIVGNASQLLESDELEEVTDAFLRLERNTATFRQTAKGLLLTVHTNDSDAWNYFTSFEEV
jgi:uncharacterized protein with von Willebrand factor type A (vWA) domain